MTPAEELTKAADALAWVAGDATEGPWIAGGIGDFGWSVHSENPRATFGVETEDSEQGRVDAAYIAAMNPELGKDLADWLHCAARLIAAKSEPYQRLISERGVSFDAPLGYALMIARRINRINQS